MIAAVLALALQAVPSVDWLVVRGEPANVGALSYERIGKLYLGGAPFRIVGPEQAGAAGSSRLVIGAVGENELTEALARALRVERDDAGLRYAGARIAPGEGLVLRLHDLDGDGRLWWFTGPDPAGTYACFTTSLGADVDGWVHVRTGAVAASGKHPLRVEPAAPLVVRLDRQAEWLAASAESFPPDEGALRVALGLFGYPTAIARAGYDDLLEYGRWLLGPGALDVERARAFYGERDLDAEIRAAWGACGALLDTDARAPIYLALHGPAGATNACTFEADPYTARPRVMLNLPALARARHFDAAILHETVHALQPAIGASLAARATHEGVATALTQVLDPTIPDEDALLWSAEELAAARAHHDEIVAAFLAHAGSTERSEHRRFMTLGAPLTEVPGAPSRTAYYCAWLAARAWLEEHPDEPPGELLAVVPGTLVAMLR